VLALLALDIQKRQERLSEIRLRERRSTLLFSIYAISLWVAYVSLWYTDLVPTLSGHARYSKYEKSVQAVPVFLGPIVYVAGFGYKLCPKLMAVYHTRILFIRRIVQIWYTRIGDREGEIPLPPCCKAVIEFCIEKHLVTLRKQQREKIDEIKKKTNYDNTRNLIERYDEGSPLKKRVPGLSAPVTPQVTPQRAQGPTPGRPNAFSPGTPVSPVGVMQPQFSREYLALFPEIAKTSYWPIAMPQQPMPPPRKHWYDKVADAILGDDDTVTGASSRYALICNKCFAHNGLVKEGLWEETRASRFLPSCFHMESDCTAPQSMFAPNVDTSIRLRERFARVVRYHARLFRLRHSLVGR
jgi:endoplasmic reticulum junction formation protein lunapark